MFNLIFSWGSHDKCHHSFVSSFTGVDLITACDIRLCTQDAWFQVKVWAFLFDCCDFNWPLFNHPFCKALCSPNLNPFYLFNSIFRITLICIDSNLNAWIDHPFLLRRLTLVWQLMSGLCSVSPEWLEVEGTCLKRVIEPVAVHWVYTIDRNILF